MFSCLRPAARTLAPRAARPSPTRRLFSEAAAKDGYAKLDVNQRAIFERLVRENPALVQATIGAAEALSRSGVESPSYEEMLAMKTQLSALDSAMAYTHQSLGQALSGNDSCVLPREPVRVAVTGPAGAIGYSLVFRIASGEMLGPNQPVILQLVEIPPMMDKLNGVVMELRDCAFPLVHGIETYSDVEKGFAGVDYALLVGSKPRGPGMERGDLLNENGKIFVGQGQALNKFASRDVKVVVVGNPANTNCLIAANNAPDLGPEQFTALTRLDHDRALAQVSQKLGCPTTAIERLCIWGNHSATQYPDLSHATVGGERVLSLINDDAWVKDTFIPTVQKRGAEIITARGASSAASAGNGAMMHIRDWVYGTKGQWTSMAIPSCDAYGVGQGVYYSYPVVCENGSYTKVYDAPISSFSAERMETTRKELFEERDMVKALLPN